MSGAAAHLTFAAVISNRCADLMFRQWHSSICFFRLRFVVIWLRYVVVRFAVATMNPSSPTPSSLSRLFPNPAVLDILGLLLLHPDRRFYQREIAQQTRCTVLQAQRALNRIVDAGLVEKRREGNRVYYWAYRDHPAFEDLKRVLIKSVALGDQLRATLQPLGDRIRLCFVYGSVAAGSEHGASDVDLFCVGDLTSREATKVFGPLGRELGREFNLVIYKEREFRDKAKGDNPFIQNVLSGPKIWLIGSDDELRQLAG